MRGRYFALPFLFAAHPALFLFAHNAAELRLPEVVPTLLWSLGFALVVLLISWGLVRDRGKAVLISSALMVVCFSYGHLSRALFTYRLGEPPSSSDLLLAPAVCLLSLGLSVCIAEGRGDLRPLLNVFAVAAVVLVSGPLLQVVPQQWERRASTLPQADTTELQVNPGAPAVKGPPPDIYYLVPDRYFGPDATKAVLGYDNQEFLSWLERKGFYLARKSRANYARTTLSLSSSLNMMYLTDLARQKGKKSQDETPTHEMIRDSAVVRFLKSRGYRYVHCGSWWDPTQENPNADLNLGSPFGRTSEFPVLLLEGTVFRPFLALLRLLPDKATRHRGVASYQLEKLQEVPAMPGPKFVFVHLLLPHPPYVFGEHGEHVAFEPREGDEVSHYRDQLKYTNTRLTELIEAILERSARPPIILLQADEGMELSAPGDRPVRAGKKTLKSSSLRRFCILNAYYLPGMNRTELYPTITPVNSFRLVLNHYFGTRLAPLPDESWLIASPFRPYDQTNVTRYLQ